MYSYLTSALLIGLLTLPSSVLEAQVYKQTDEQGNVTFTDSPSKKAEAITLPPTNTAPPITSRQRFAPSRPNPDDLDANDYENLRITKPADGTIIPNGPGNFSVTTRLSPQLESNHQLQLLLNGKVHMTGQQEQFELTYTPRGRHSLQAQVVNKAGKVLIRSNTVQVQVYRPSTN